MRAFFPSVVLCSVISIASSAHGNTLLKAPIGSAPNDNSFRLIVDNNGHSLSFVVDSKGLYDHDAWSRSENSPIGGSNDDKGIGKGATSNLSPAGFGSRGFLASGGGLFAGGSGGAGAGGGGLSSLKGLEGFSLAGSNKDLISLAGFLSHTDGAFGLGSEGGLKDSPSVATTPLPPSWTMLFLGLAGLGYFAQRWQKKGNALSAA